jgi:hypothetical protein
MEGRAGAADFNWIAETFFLKFQCFDSNSTTPSPQYRSQCAIENHCSQMRVKEFVRVILLPRSRIDSSCQNGRDMVASLPSTSAQPTGVKKRERCSWALRMFLILIMFAAVPAHDDACLRGELLFPSHSLARERTLSLPRARCSLSLSCSVAPSLPPWLSLNLSFFIHCLTLTSHSFAHLFPHSPVFRFFRRFFSHQLTVSRAILVALSVLMHPPWH